MLLVGWDSGDVKLVDEAVAAGRMPAVSRLIASGAVGELATVGPPVGPIAWTTIATGVRGDRHGVLAELEIDRVSGDCGPVSCRGRAVKALWNIASQAGRRSIVVNWSASHPAEPIRGVCVDERFAIPTGPLEAEWPVAEASVHPAAIAERLAPCRVHPSEFRREDLLAFVPRLSEIDLVADRRPVELAAALARCVGVHAAATALLEWEAWDFAAIRYRLLGDLAPTLLRCRAPRVEGVADGDAERYGQVLDIACGLLDGMLARLLELAGPDTTLVLVSERGLDIGPSRVPLRPTGLALIAGPGVRPDSLLHGANALDIAPTVLGLLSIPPGLDMPGRVLREAFEEPPADDRIGSWEAIEGEAGLHPRLETAPWREHAEIRRLASLGYAESTPAEEAHEASLAAHAALNRALIHLEACEWREAIPSLRQVLATRRGHPQASMLLATALLMTGDREHLAELPALALATAAEPVLAPYSDLIRGLSSAAEGRTEEAFAAFEECERTGLPSGLLFERLGLAYLELGRSVDAERLLRRSLELEPDGRFARFALAGIHLERGRPEEAAAESLRAIGRQYRWPEAHARLGVALLRLGRQPEAWRAFELSISQRPTATAHDGLAVLLAADPAQAARHREEADALRKAGRP